MKVTARRDLGACSRRSGRDTGSPSLRSRQLGLRHEEAHLDVAGRQHRTASAGRPARSLAGAVIDLLHRAGDRAQRLAAREPRLRVTSRACAVRSAASASSSVFCVPAAVFSSVCARS